jgi:hypothetical protein
MSLSQSPTSRTSTLDILSLVPASAARRAGLGFPRCQDLVNDLPATAAKLGKRRASEIDPADLDDYVSLQWLQWNGGNLELTDVGRNLIQLVGNYQPA